MCEVIVWMPPNGKPQGIFSGATPCVACIINNISTSLDGNVKTRLVLMLCERALYSRPACYAIAPLGFRVGWDDVLYVGVVASVIRVGWDGFVTVVLLR